MKMSLRLRSVSPLRRLDSMTLDRRESEKALLPTKLTRLMAVRPPSLIWKTTSARLSPSGVTIDLDRRLAPALARVVLRDALDVALQLGVGQNPARLGLQDLEQDVVLDLLVAADHDLVDDRILDDGDDKAAAADVDADIRKQPGAVKGLHRLVDIAAAERLAGCDQDVVAHGRSVDARVAGNHDAGDDRGLCRTSTRSTPSPLRRYHRRGEPARGPHSELVA